LPLIFPGFGGEKIDRPLPMFISSGHLAARTRYMPPGMASGR
jgi:hypothetical protein